MKILNLYALTMLAACQNETTEGLTTQQNPETFVSKASGEELPQLTPEQEKEMIADAIVIVKASRQKEIDGDLSKDKNATTILCHTNYNEPRGHACVWSNGYLVSVVWSPEFILGPGGNSGYENYENIIYTGQVTPRCSC